MEKGHDGLTEVPRIKRHFECNQEWNFGKGDVREAFQRVYSPKKNYVLFQTSANPEAAEALKQQGNGLIFGNNLMDSYQHTIDQLAKIGLGKKNFSHYSIVSTNGVHNLDRDPNEIFWPRVYIVDEKKQKNLKGIIDNLSGDESLEVLREHEYPQFYQIPGIEALHKLGIAPIVRLEREWNVGAQELSKYVDFLAQMTESYKWTGSVIDVD